MEFNPEGIRTHTEICRSAIRSARRFNYDEVQDFYDKKSMGKQWKPEIQELLTNLHGFMQLSRKRRFARGSLEMDIPETKIVLDESGKVADAHVYPYYDSNRVIEECMLAANEAVADFLAEKNISFIRRVHSGPSSRKLRGFTDFIHALGLNKWDTDDFYHDRKNIQRLLDTVRGTAQEYAVNFSLLRAMQRAVYAVEPEGHYALASDCYTHYTSPIRRYPDLSVHRLLDEILDGKTPQPDLRAQILLAEHCSDREQRATDAERELTKLKIIDYLSQHIGEYIEAMVTTVEPFGVFVMGTKIPAEGLIRIEGLRDDVYRFEPSAKILMGQRNDNTLRIGDRLLVEVVRADADARQVDFCLVKRLKRDQSAPKTVAKKPRKRK